MLNDIEPCQYILLQVLKNIEAHWNISKNMIRWAWTCGWPASVLRFWASCFSNAMTEGFAAWCWWTVAALARLAFSLGWESHRRNKKTLVHAKRCWRLRNFKHAIYKRSWMFWDTWLLITVIRGEVYGAFGFTVTSLLKRHPYSNADIAILHNYLNHYSLSIISVLQVTWWFWNCLGFHRIRYVCKNLIKIGC